MTMQALSDNRIVSFVSVRITNVSHGLILVVACSCNCFDALRVRNQWEIINKLWSNECALKWFGLLWVMLRIVIVVTYY